MRVCAAREQAEPEPCVCLRCVRAQDFTIRILCLTQFSSLMQPLRRGQLFAQRLDNREPAFLFTHAAIV